MTRTESERLFESFCEAHGVWCRRVTEATEPRPDYELEIAGQPVVAEVKQFDPNEEERSAADRIARGEVVVLGATPGGRLRRVIGDANGQLRQLLADRSIPTILVVYNNTECSLHTQPYAVMTAMQGLDVVDVVVPMHPGEPLRWDAVRSGSGRAMRPDANTSTSAVAVLVVFNPKEFGLTVYHNRFAACPLDPNLMRFPGVRHFRLPIATNSVDRAWDEV